MSENETRGAAPAAKVPDAGLLDDKSLQSTERRAVNLTASPAPHEPANGPRQRRDMRQLRGAHVATASAPRPFYRNAPSSIVAIIPRYNGARWIATPLGSNHSLGTAVTARKTNPEGRQRARIGRITGSGHRSRTDQLLTVRSRGLLMSQFHNAPDKRALSVTVLRV
jgi:hypothetical protein